MRYYWLFWIALGIPRSHKIIYLFLRIPQFFNLQPQTFFEFFVSLFFQLYISYPYFLSFVLILCDPVLISAGIWVQVQYIYLKQRSWSIICCFQDLPCIIHTVNILNLPSFVHLSRFIINGQSFAIMSRFFSSLL